ncbi:MAG: flagellar protein FlbB [Spirochaetaceae bacterium]|nr:flagellar protein FlbB [Spirochaetaceae bacterium]MBO4705268.1 flagellar protein FlbB [Spirochaetaceae bacterium]
MSAAKTIGKTIVLLILIVIMILAGLLWFDHLGVIEMRDTFDWFYKLIGLTPQTSVTVENPENIDLADLGNDRIKKIIEEYEIRSQELDKREENIVTREAQNEQMAQELDDRRIALEESEKTFNNERKRAEDRDANIRTRAEYLSSMPPKSAVDILLAMDDQDFIDTIRMVDKIAAESGSDSNVSYWLTLMPPERVAEITRKMEAKPQSIN